ncbi:Sjogren's syndrome/scleroderma autoantigen 1 family protein [Halobellus inordinatus]|uniref:Sjogren's syndrome/scleroderma autoantigen 1 family protein n=1 Tax=Halobellus inordinatus TaxID=1126236 RepID=UPI0021142094|nr:Sjogren's syndrome/scleroderma autoantigen 1 family protein [Halobellus ramosii]
MSDFDEEAERKRLREKYEKDEERRKETQQMSELLLKGATMTNRHCDECGAPIFRYQGQEFCPSCQRVAGGEQAQAGGAGADAETEPEAQAAESPAASGSPEPTADATDASAGAQREPESIEVDAVSPAERSAEAAADQIPDAGTTPSSAASTPSTESAANGRHESTPVTATPRPEATAAPDSEGRTEGVSTADGAADRQTARESLLRALTRHAQLAEQTDDPRRASEHLSAAREAAAALDVLDQ